MENHFFLDYEVKVHTFLSKTDSSETASSDWVFEKYKSGLVSTDAPFQLFETHDSVSVQNQTSDDSPKNRRFRGPYRKYTFDEKMLAVEKIQKGQDVKEVSKEYGIPRRNLLRWRKNGCQRKEGGGRPTDEDMERTLYDKIKNREITGEKEIRNGAIALSKSPSFKASKGWFLKFCRRFQLSICGQTPKFCQ